MRFPIAEIRERKVVRWAAAYAAAAWVVLQALHFLADTYQWPQQVVRIAPVVAITGFVVTIIVTWYHGERGDQTISAGEVLLLLGAIALGTAGSILVVARPAHHHNPPLVVMMDSPNPHRVYDEETVRQNGTNADVVSDILADLPIQRQKESIGPGWHRDEEIRMFKPDLIIIHWSAFCHDTCTMQPDPHARLRQFLEYFADDPAAHILIYSRGGAWSNTCGLVRNCEMRLRAMVDSMLTGLYAEHESFADRVEVFGIQDYGPPHWKDPTVAAAFKLRVRRILDLTS